MDKAAADRIGNLLDEHAQIKKDFMRLERQITDQDSASRLNMVREKIGAEAVPPSSWAAELEKTANRVEKELTAHFRQEEQSLAEAYESFSQDAGIQSSLNALRTDHVELLSQIKDLLSEARQLSQSDPANHDETKAKAFLLKVRLTNIRVALEHHAEHETMMFERLRQRLLGS